MAARTNGSSGVKPERSLARPLQHTSDTSNLLNLVNLYIEYIYYIEY